VQPAAAQASPPEPGPAQPSPAESGPAQLGFLEMPLGQFLGEMASSAPAPGGGGAAALSVALGASLCAMTAQLSERRLGIPAAEALTTDAKRISRLAASLIQADAEAYRRVISAKRSPAGDDPGDRERAVAAALSAATDVPMQIVEAGAEATRLAARLAAGGNPVLRGDAIAAAVLAAAGARAAAALVSINLAGTDSDDRPARAASLLADAGRAAQQAQATHP